MIATPNMEETSNSGTSTNHHSNDGTKFNPTDAELEVVNVLCHLPYLLIHRYEICLAALPYNWVTKRRRSVLPSPSPSPSTMKTIVNHDIRSSTIVKPEARSPNTPLCFSPSEPDCIKSSTTRTTNKRKASCKLRAEELQSSIDERIQTQQVLKKEIENVKCHLSKLQSENISLKAQKLELEKSLGYKRAKKTESKEREELNLVTQSASLTQGHQTTIPVGVNDHVHEVASTSTQVHHHRPLVCQPRSIHLNHPIGPSHHQQEQFFQHHQPQDQLGPQLGLFTFDLNLPAEELDRRLMGVANNAQTRMNRQHRIREMRLRRTKQQQFSLAT